MRLLLTLGIVLGLTGAQATVLHAQPAITDSNYRIELHQGPVLGSTRVIGLSGAYVAVAEGAVGLPFNPAAVAHRAHYSRSWFDWDLSIDYLKPGTFQTRSFDLDGNGRALRTSFHMVNTGGLLQFGAFGLGIHVQGQFSDFEDQSTPPQAFTASLTQTHITVGYALADHQLVLGGGFTIGSFDVNYVQTGEEDARDGFSTQIPGLEVGVLVRLKSLPLRFAATASFAFAPQVSLDCGDDCPVGFFLPEGVAVPWQLRTGVSYRWGQRRFNQPFRILKKTKKKPPKPPPTKKKAGSSIKPKPEPKHTGEYFVLVSAELVMTGAVKDAVGTDGFLDQIQERAGQRITVSARLGVEAEVWRRRLRLRGGTYWEPSRYDGRAGRLHGTVGFALRLFDFRLWGTHSLAISAAFDGSYQYTNLSLSVGFWH